MEDVEESRPICLKCKNLVWSGFLADCIYILVDDSLFSEAIELAEAKLAGKTEKEIAVIEQQQEIRFDNSLADQLMAIPYMVWRRKKITKYYEHAPKTVNECPFRYEPVEVNASNLIERALDILHKRNESL